MKRSPMPSTDKPMKHTPMERRTRVKAGNPKRKAWKFKRNFHSKERVEFGKTRTCYSCREKRAVVNAHINGARGMGGCGGTFLEIAPLCEDCDAGSTARPVTFWEERNIDPADLCAEFEGDWVAHCEEDAW